MKNKITPGQRGRPRLFSEPDVLRRAQRVFLEQGFEATAYEDIARSTGLSKPSLYNAFGDKTALFERAIAEYAEHARQHILSSFNSAANFAEACRKMLLAAADVYAESGKSSTGCLLVGTALPGCTQNVQIQKTLSDFITALQGDLEKVITSHFSADARVLGKTPRALSLLVCSLLFSLAIHARTGVSRHKLRKIAGELAETLA